MMYHTWKSYMLFSRKCPSCIIYWMPLVQKHWSHGSILVLHLYVVTFVYPYYAKISTRELTTPHVTYDNFRDYYRQISDTFPWYSVWFMNWQLEIISCRPILGHRRVSSCKLPTNHDCLKDWLPMLKVFCKYW